VLSKTLVEPDDRAVGNAGVAQDGRGVLLRGGEAGQAPRNLPDDVARQRQDHERRQPRVVERGGAELARRGATVQDDASNPFTASRSRCQARRRERRRRRLPGRKAARGSWRRRADSNPSPSPTSTATGSSTWWVSTCTPTCGVSGNDRAGLERLCRYILRPPFAQERLRLRSDGRIALELKTPWHDGTRELVFEPLELLERLAAMTPRPETNLLICHGLLAARARWRERVVAYGRVAPEPTASTPPLAPGSQSTSEGTKAKSGSRGWSRAALMHRAFAIDVLACPNCGGRLRLIATLQSMNSKSPTAA
jgi:hypothetical protein